MTLSNDYLGSKPGAVCFVVKHIVCARIASYCILLLDILLWKWLLALAQSVFIWSCNHTWSAVLMCGFLKAPDIVIFPCDVRNPPRHTSCLELCCFCYCSIFRKPYFVGRFLPSLLAPRPVSINTMSTLFNANLSSADKMRCSYWQQSVGSWCSDKILS